MATPIAPPVDDRDLLLGARAALHRLNMPGCVRDADMVEEVLARYAVYSEALDRIARWNETPQEDRTAWDVSTIAKVARAET